MLCPVCRRMVGKDGYCPEGHPLRPMPEEPDAFARPAPPAGTPDDAVPAPQAMGPPPVPAAAGGPPGGPNPAGRKPRRAIAVVAALALVAAGATTYVVFGPGGSAGADLRRVFTAGEEHRYAFEMTMRGSGGNLSGGFNVDMVITAELTQRTMSVDNDGVARVRFTIDNISVTTDGRTVSAPPGAGESMTVRMEPDGKVTSIDGGDPLGLEDVNPMAGFISPSNVGPLLPDRKVRVGDSWTVETEEVEPETDLKIKVTTANTLMDRRDVGGDPAAIIRSDVTIPIDLRLSRDQLVKLADGSDEDTNTLPKDAAFVLGGNMRMTLSQTILTRTGILQSVLGDGFLRGTTTIEGVPQLGTLSVVFDLNFTITMTRISAGKSA